MTDRFKDRFDGAAAWAALPPEHQAAIGAAALEIVVNWSGLDSDNDASLIRPFEAADSLLLDTLQSAVEAALPKAIAADPPPVPSRLGPVCRVCGCSEHDACFGPDGPCAWAEDDLCTACAGGAAEKADA